jgi:hypothetical protein
MVGFWPQVVTRSGKSVFWDVANAPNLSASLGTPAHDGARFCAELEGYETLRPRAARDKADLR